MAVSTIKKDLYAKIVTVNRPDQTVVTGTAISIINISDYVPSGKEFVGAMRLYSTIGGNHDQGGTIFTTTSLTAISYWPAKNGSGLTVSVCILYR